MTQEPIPFALVAAAYAVTDSVLVLPPWGTGRGRDLACRRGWMP